jgi:flagellar basal body-associated protein FliL
MFIRCLLVLGLGMFVACVSGCGSAPVQVAGMDVPEIMELLEDEQLKRNPQAYSEVDLGKFKVTRMLSADDGQLVVRFHLIGVVPETKQTEFTESMPKYETRLRDAILALVQRAEPEHLSDPALSYLKSEMLVIINNQMHTRHLKSVAFSDLSIERK